MNKLLLPKDSENIPDSYGIEFTYYDGSKLSYKVASHTFLKEVRAIEVVTSDDLYTVVPLDMVKTIDFDKQFSKFYEEMKRIKKERLKNEAIQR